MEAAPHRHADAEGPQGAVPQCLPAHHRHVWLVLGRGHLQLVVGPDGRPALAQQGLGTRQGPVRGKDVSGCPRSGGFSPRILQDCQGSGRKLMFCRHF